MVNIGKLLNVAKQIVRKEPQRRALNVLKSIEIGAKSAEKAAPKVHENYGEILQMAKRTPKDIFTSKPTQQVIDNELTYAGRMDKLKETGGVYLDRKAVADARWAFTHTTTPVKLESVPTKEAIEKLNNVKLVDELRNAEVMGELTPAMKQKRADMLAAFESFNENPASRDFEKFKHDFGATCKEFLDEMCKIYHSEAKVPKSIDITRVEKFLKDYK